MLSYAYQTLRETGYRKVAVEDFENVHDLFAAILITGVSAQIKRGLFRDYLEYERSLSGVRGQILVSETINQLTLHTGRLVCSFDEFVPDTLHNQVLKCVLLLLLRHSYVKPDNKKALLKILLYFSKVSEIAPASIRWDELKYHRNNASYRMLMEICRLTIRGLLLTTGKGGHKLATWIQDEAMHRLFEKFVLSYYQYHHPDYNPKVANIEWDLSEGTSSHYLPIMKTDITLQKRDKRLIIDTKYYKRAMQYHSVFNTIKYHSNNLYQIYTYVKNSDKFSTGNVAGVLLYAKTDESITPDEDMIIGGNHISVKTLDLNQRWEGITSQLEQLCEWLEWE